MVANTANKEMNKSYLDYKMAEKKKNEAYTQYTIEYLEKWVPRMKWLENIYLALLFVLFLKNVYYYRKNRKMSDKLVILFVLFGFAYFMAGVHLKYFTY